MIGDYDDTIHVVYLQEEGMLYQLRWHIVWTHHVALGQA